MSGDGTPPGATAERIIATLIRRCIRGIDGNLRMAGISATFVYFVQVPGPGNSTMVDSRHIHADALAGMDDRDILRITEYWVPWVNLRVNILGRDADHLRTRVNRLLNDIHAGPIPVPERRRDNGEFLHYEYLCLAGFRRCISIMGLLEGDLGFPKHIRLTNAIHKRVNTYRGPWPGTAI